VSGPESRACKSKLHGRLGPRDVVAQPEQDLSQGTSVVAEIDTIFRLIRAGSHSGAVMGRCLGKQVASPYRFLVQAPNQSDVDHRSRQIISIIGLVRKFSNEFLIECQGITIEHLCLLGSAGPIEQGTELVVTHGQVAAVFRGAAGIAKQFFPKRQSLAQGSLRLGIAAGKLEEPGQTEE